MENNQFASDQMPTQPPMQSPVPPQEPSTGPIKPAKPSAAPSRKHPHRATGIIIALIVILGGLLALYFLVWRQPSPEKAVSGAVEKLLSADAPQKVVFIGSTTYTPLSESSSNNQIIVTSKNQFDFTRAAEASTINIQIQTDNSTTSVTIESIFFADGTVYLSLNNLIELLQSSDIYPAIKAADLALKASGSDFSIYDTIAGTEGQWLEVDLGTALNYLKEYFNIDIEKDTKIENNLMTEAIGCIVTESDKFLSNSAQITKLYQQNNFLTAESSLGGEVEKKQNPLYKITVNPAKLSDFVNAGISADLYNGLYNCFGLKPEGQTIQMTTAETFASIANYYEGGLFVEINGQNDITRTYLKGISDNYEIINDFDVVYPDEIIIAKPTEYVSLENLIKQIKQAIRVAD